MSQISVIVPVYKVEQYLQRCVDSILAQTFTDYELILIDDGSPDMSGQMDDEYAAQDDRIVSIHHNNGGASAARNVGLDIVRGANITFIDPDDYVLPAYIRELYQPEYDMVCQTLALVGEDGHIIKERELPECRYNNPNENDIMVMLLNKALSYAPCKCYKSSIIQTNGIRFNTDIDNGEDILFSVQYIKKAISVLVQNNSNYRYVRYESHTTLSRPNSKQRIDMVINAYRLISLEVSDNPEKQNEIFIKKSLWAYNRYWKNYYEAYSPFQIGKRLSCLWHLTEDLGFHSVLQSGKTYSLSDEMLTAIVSGSKLRVTFAYIHFCLYLLKKKIFRY